MKEVIELTTIWQTVKGYLAAGVALVACPCHLPITLPLVIGLTAGTAFSVWAQNNFLTIAGISTVLFLGGLVLAFKWMTAEPQARPAGKRTAPANVILVTSQTCANCASAAELWESLQPVHKFRLQKVEITSGEGRSLAAKYNILSTPTTIIDGRVVFRQPPSRLRAALTVQR